MRSSDSSTPAESLPSRTASQRPPHIRSEHRRARQEAHLLVRQPREQLEPQIVGHEAVVAAERRDAGATRLERQRGQIEARRPALGSLGELRHGGLVELDARVAQQRRRLLDVQAQIVRADLQHAPLRPQARQRQRGLLPARHDDPRSLRNVVDRARRPRRGSSDRTEMQVVEHQHDRARDRRERRADPRDAGRPDRPAGRRERLEHRRRNGLDPVQRGRDVAQQDHRIVVALVERHRRERPLVPLRQVREQRRLAEAGRRHHAHHARLRRAQPVDQLRLHHRVHAQRRRRELGLDQLVRKGRGHHAAPSLAERAGGSITPPG